ncbi:MAG TPA: nuclear transport factor 2 family protein [Caulobacteraceae bacterium]|jgi:ketosteroid isomerase-like protein|nr:nuclear transport factor 2 family protein [Caulobacteraceae bacterium]
MSTTLSRRILFAAGAGTVAGTALGPNPATAQGRAGEIARNKALITHYYKSWEVRDWAPFDAMLAQGFIFTSPNDDHIDRAAFKARCWDSQVDFIKGFDLEVLMAKGDQVVVEYLCHTKNGKALRNVEIHRVRGGRIQSIDCYFGGAASFPSAVSAKKS